MALIVSDENKLRFDAYLVLKKLVPSRHQAADLIRRRQVKINHQLLDKPASLIDLRTKQRVQLLTEAYVSRGGYKLEKAAQVLNLNFRQAIVLDVGANQGGFSDYVNRQGAKCIVAVDIGKQGLAKSLQNLDHILAFSRIDIRQFKWPPGLDLPDFIVADVSFISLRHILNHLLIFCRPQTKILVLVKPQFEATPQALKKGIVKNQALRRQILKDFEIWLRSEAWQILAKTDSQLRGLKGNLERFYLLKPQV